MKKSIYTVVITISTLACGLCSCSSIGVSRGKKYDKLYLEQPTKITVLPVINQSGEKECVPYFENTVDSILIKKGYEVLKNGSKKDLLASINTQSNTTPNADAFFETIIKKWHTSKVEGLFEVDIVYSIRSLSTGDTLFFKEGNLIVDSYLKLGGGRLINLIATSVKSTTMNKSWVGKTCGEYLLFDLPEGPHGPTYMNDKNKRAGETLVCKKIKCLKAE